MTCSDQPSMSALRLDLCFSTGASRAALEGPAGPEPVWHWSRGLEVAFYQGLIQFFNAIFGGASSNWSNMICNHWTTPLDYTKICRKPFWANITLAWDHSIGQKCAIHKPARARPNGPLKHGWKWGEQLSTWAVMSLDGGTCSPWLVQTAQIWVNWRPWHVLWKLWRRSASKNILNLWVRSYRIHTVSSSGFFLEPIPELHHKCLTAWVRNWHSIMVQPVNFSQNGGEWLLIYSIGSKFHPGKPQFIRALTMIKLRGRFYNGTVDAWPQEYVIRVYNDPKNIPVAITFLFWLGCGKMLKTFESNMHREATNKQ